MLMLYFCFSQRSHILAIPLYKRLRNLLGLEGCIFWPQETCISASWAGAKERQWVGWRDTWRAAEWWDFGEKLRMYIINDDECVSTSVLGMDIEALLYTEP